MHLIIGGDGTIGAALERHLLQHGIAVTSTTRRPEAASPDRPLLDLLDWRASEILSLDPEVVYLCAGISGSRRCADHPDTTRRCNVDAPAAIATAFASRGAHIVFLSTNAVLAGASPAQPLDAPRAPNSEYGVQKATAERALQRDVAQASIVRLTKVIGPETEPFSAWRRALSQGMQVEAASDMYLAPITLSFAVEAIVRAAQVRVAGLMHVSGDADLSFAEFAFALARRLGKNVSLVSPVPAARFGVDVSRYPRYTSLDMSREREKLGITVEPLSRVLAEIAA